MDRTMFTLAHGIAVWAPTSPWDDAAPEDDTPLAVLPAGTKVTLRLTYSGEHSGNTPDYWAFDAFTEHTPAYRVAVLGRDIVEDITTVWWCKAHYEARDPEGYPVAVQCGAPRHMIDDATGAHGCEAGCYFRPVANQAEEYEAMLNERAREFDYRYA